MLLALASCGKSSAPPPPPAATLVPILPDSITLRLGTVGLALAVDFHAIDVRALFGAHPPQVPCAHDLIVGVREAVATVGDGGWQGIIDGLPEAPTRACLAQLGIAAQGSGDGLALAVLGKQLIARWRGDVATLVEAGAPERHGDVPGVMHDAIAKIPRDVAAWLAITGLPDFKIAQAVGWLDAGTKAWTITVEATGATPTAAKEWIDTLVRGFTVKLAASGTTVDGSWFKVTDEAPNAKLVATIPTGALGAGSN